jgi:uncharacterized protein YndB with AHSA1/START domain
MSVDAIEREIDIDAPIDVVWQTIADPEQIQKWFADRVEVESRVGATGTLTFRADSDDPHVVGITIVTVDRPHCFAYRWVHPPGEPATEANSTLVTMTLTQLDHERTRLRVVESGLESMDLTAEEKRRFADDHRNGWRVQGERLRELLSVAPPPRS